MYSVKEDGEKVTGIENNEGRSRVFMNGISKKIFVLWVVVSILITLGFTKNAYAEWENEGSQWKYIGDYGYKIGWQQIEGKWYYFNLETGIMKIGWFYDEKYNKWYYLNSNGYMESSKTTSNYPVELSRVQDKINQYSYEETIYKGTDQIDSNMFVCFMSKNESSPREYYYQPSTGNVYEIKDGILTNIVTHEVVNILTEEQAVQLVKDYLSKEHKYIPQIIKVESNKGDSYLIHCYDDMSGYTATSGWYYVNKTTREVKTMI